MQCRTGAVSRCCSGSATTLEGWVRVRPKVWGCPRAPAGPLLLARGVGGVGGLARARREHHVRPARGPGGRPSGRRRRLRRPVLASGRPGERRRLQHRRRLRRRRLRLLRLPLPLLELVERRLLLLRALGHLQVWEGLLLLLRLLLLALGRHHRPCGQRPRRHRRVQLALELGVLVGGGVVEPPDELLLLRLDAGDALGLRGVSTPAVLRLGAAALLGGGVGVRSLDRVGVRIGLGLG